LTVQELIKKAESSGLTIRVEGDMIEVRAAQEPEGEARALIKELRERKPEVIKALTSEVTPEAVADSQKVPSCWNCAAPMDPARDIYGVKCFVCPACEVSSEDLEAQPNLSRSWRVEEIRSDSGEIQAVLICSGILQDDLWVVYDRSFEPKDSLAIYYGEEMGELVKKTVDEQRVIHKVKLAFPGCRVIQEGPEKAKTGELLGE